MRKVAAFDPGNSGALAVYGESAETQVYPIPRTAGVISGRELIDFKSLWVLCELVLADPEIEDVVIEDVGVMPRQGGVSGFNFGYGAGALRMCAIAMGKRPRMVRPSIWKKAMGLNDDKNASRALVVKLGILPTERVAKVKDDGLAEAALLAYYGYVNPPGDGEEGTWHAVKNGEATRKRAKKARRAKSDGKGNKHKLGGSPQTVPRSSRPKPRAAAKAGGKVKRTNDSRRQRKKTYT